VIEDWEIGALYWTAWKQAEGDETEANRLSEKKIFWRVLNTRDLHLFVGTTKQYHNVAPNPFLIIGVSTASHQDIGQESFWIVILHLGFGFVTFEKFGIKRMHLYQALNELVAQWRRADYLHSEIPKSLKFLNGQKPRRLSGFVLRQSQIRHWKRLGFAAATKYLLMFDLYKHSFSSRQSYWRHLGISSRHLKQQILWRKLWGKIRTDASFCWKV